MNDKNEEKPAGFKRRVWAFVIDVVISIVLLNIVLLVFGIVKWYSKSGGTFTYGVEHHDPGAFYMYIIWYGAVFIVYSWLTTYYWNGQTIGKNILKIRIVSLDGFKMTNRRALIRSLSYVITLLQFSKSIIKYYCDNNSPVTHDRIAKTKVIYEPIPPPEPPPKPKKGKPRRSLLR
ncbi:MAG: RDD family protein [candidate division Zixibacteria bacterium]|nr:RDD family protein [candidate division Zixibacteria bacterium]